MYAKGITLRPTHCLRGSVESSYLGKEKNFAGFSKLHKIAGAGTPLKDWISAQIVITTFEFFYGAIFTAPDIVKNFWLAIVDEDKKEIGEWLEANVVEVP